MGPEKTLDALRAGCDEGHGRDWTARVAPTQLTAWCASGMLPNYKNREALGRLQGDIVWRGTIDVPSSIRIWLRGPSMI